MQSPWRHCRNSRNLRSISNCCFGSCMAGPLVEIMKGTASMRNPDTPNWIQNPMIFSISACTSGCEVLRSGWKSYKRWKYQALASRLWFQVDFWTPGKTIPLSAYLGLVFDQTYQFRYFDFGSDRACLNQGCWSDVWFTARSIRTRIPCCFAPCVNSTKSPSVPYRGSTL